MSGLIVLLPQMGDAAAPSPIAWLAILGTIGGAMGAVFAYAIRQGDGRLKDKDDRTRRCEQREDDLLKTSAESTATQRTTAAAAERAVTFAERAVSIAETGVTETRRNGEKLDSLARQIETLSRRLDDLASGAPSAARRRPS